MWCHNPEGLAAYPELFYHAQKCIGCGACGYAGESDDSGGVCPGSAHKFIDGMHIYDRSFCIRCGACAKVCCTLALEIAGKEMTAQSVIAEVLRDKPFYDNSGGGMTVSGGEPFFQPGFLLTLLRMAKESGLHTCIETSGYGKKDDILESARYTDLFLYDIKETDSGKHKEYTGVDNTIILDNLRSLDEAGADIILRCPVIPGLNDREDHFTAVATLADSLNSVKQITVLPYHPLGVSKSERLGRLPALPRNEFVSEDIVNIWVQSIKEKTDCRVKVNHDG